jgi:hypothetical protein
MRSVLILLVITTMGGFASGCSDSAGTDGEIVGVVTEVTGDLSGIESFVILDTDGDSHKFIPRSGLMILGAPPSHLRDHVVSGIPVKVIYHEGPDSELIADEVMDADG